ncbi:MAG: hypothetical protein Q8R28_16420, partial [Dehalococcoidia bacterium]|nr:hypothetical protein [Dehalococcoidia bacterium]
MTTGPSLIPPALVRLELVDHLLYLVRDDLIDRMRPGEPATEEQRQLVHLAEDLMARTAALEKELQAGAPPPAPAPGSSWARDVVASFEADVARLGAEADRLGAAFDRL